MYAYNADLWCDSCGLAIAAELDEEGIEDTRDTDQYPQSFPEGESDSPSHCASGAECLEALDLTEYGLPAGAAMHGAETPKIGAWIEEDLTDHGREYLAEMLAETPRTPYQEALHRFWREVYEVPEDRDDE